VEVLVEKTIRAAKAYGAKQILLAGGVAANRGLRTALGERCGQEGLPLVIPPLVLCTDNAAMIAAAGYVSYTKGEFAGLDLNGIAGLDLTASFLS
jgi:N6-L-threonylcarbamoyladenine synthase